MTLEYVANEDCLIELGNTAGPPDLVYTGDVGITDPAITAIVSTKCKASAKGVCVTSFVFVWVVAGSDCPHTSITNDFVSGASTIVATAIKTKAEGSVVMRLGDASACVGTWKLKIAPFTVTPCACNIEVSDAGQVKVKAQ